ncbi:MAG: hypothetical protein KJ607_01620 [Bacteroidetes bacterium]|nr:hypothetical protein [Bacteroidota bacterium]
MKIITSVLIAFFAILSVSCNMYESAVPIAGPEKSTLDTTLTGFWRVYETSDTTPVDNFLMIIPFNEKEYLITTFSVVDSMMKDMMQLRVYNSFVGKQELFNVTVLEPEPQKTSWIFFRLDKITTDSIKVDYLDEDFADTTFATSKKLCKYMKNNADSMMRSFVRYGIIKKENKVEFK